MFANSNLSRAKRRGIVLVVVLGMLGLLALIGVTFATFSSQAQINARNFAMAQAFPDATEMLDFALSQLIEDTSNPQSVIRGHSIKRDMYGNDAATNGALLYGRPDNSNPMLITDASLVMPGLPFAGYVKLTTNIPANDPAFYAYTLPWSSSTATATKNYFTRWVLRFPSFVNPTKLNLGASIPSGPTFMVSESHEIQFDVMNDASGYRVFYVWPPYNSAVTGAGNPATIKGYISPQAPPPTGPQQSALPSSAQKSPVFEVNGFPNGVPVSGSSGTYPFLLDGRYLRAFNGPGIGTLPEVRPNGSVLPPRSMAEYANFRYNGNLLLNSLIIPGGSGTAQFSPLIGNPDFAGDVDGLGRPMHYPMPSMDEDYDACDLENWFLAIQTADGEVAIPSFHRPGILSGDPVNYATDNDWTRVYNSAATADQQMKALRAMSRILRPRRVDGHSPVSFPDLTPDIHSGKITYDVDNDGDGHTDSVWLDLGYPPKRSPEGQLFKPLFAFMVIGLNGKLPLNSAGNLQDRSAKELPTFSHTDHLGNSPSEIDIRYALQNAYYRDPNDPTTGVRFSSQYNPFVWNAGGGPGVATAGANQAWNHPYMQVDNAGVNTAGDTPVPVWLTQLRNLLAGMRTPDASYDPNNPPPPVGTGSNPLQNGDINAVAVNNRYVLLPNGVADISDYPAGGPVSVFTAPVEGRWGEGDWIPKGANVLVETNPQQQDVTSLLYGNIVRAGHSALYPPPNGAPDARDDNFNTYDVWPSPGTNAESDGTINSVYYPADFYDISGSISLPVERIRRFVNPIDASGDGDVVTFNPGKGGRAGRPRNLGGDGFGRVNFFHYFRPPGVPVPTYIATSTTLPSTPGPLSRDSANNLPNAVWFNPSGYDARTNNLYHGFLAAVAPSAGSNFTNTLAFAGMPSDYQAGAGSGSVGTLNSTTATVPTFDTIVNSNAAFISPGLNEADEMDLYGPTRLDNPFEPSDLEWLYRAQDVDGGSLQSRLSQLAPVSFNNPLDGTRRRRLFTLETWEPTNFVYANDNPSGAFPNNHRFTQLADASLMNLAGLTPPLAQRDRRINLNFPLPVSNSPIEPLRQKWIRETYTLLKQVLPPKAVDTPEELAQLSQFVVNIVDFRDPDCTMTKFVNTDIIVAEPADQASPATASATLTANTGTPSVAYDATITPSTNSSHYLIQYGMEYQPVAINEVLAFNAYEKVVEVTSPGSPNPSNFVPRMFIELVNTLTKDALANTPDSCDLDLTGWDFVILPDNTGLGRPDPFTGQIPQQYKTGGSPTALSSYWLNGTQATTTTPTTGASPVIPALSPTVQYPVPGSNNGEGTNYYYVFANTDRVTTGLNPPIVPASTNPLDPMVSSSLTTDNMYYWLYLRRPPNPFDASYDPKAPNDNRVVVDCFRFIYTKSHGTGYTDTTGGNKVDKIDVKPGGDRLFSLQRMQPFRGGHAVPPLTALATAKNYVQTAYGYSEQTSVEPPTAATRYVNYGTVQTTNAIMETLGLANNPGDDSWDYPVFNDRDFTSVVELLNVPSCAPGLFTKQFAEVPPPVVSASTGVAGSVATQAGATIDPSTWSSSTPPTPWNGVGTSAVGPQKFSGNAAPHPFPYLNDEFFYTASNENTTATNPTWWPEVPSNPSPFRSPSTATTTPVFPGNYIGGPGGAGWHKMLDFFEVPSPAFKAIGNVALGTNYDWARQDLRPGLLNLNLIVDEEVFLGLMGRGLYGEIANPDQGVLNAAQVNNKQVPAVVTMTDDYGSPIFNYNMNNVGLLDTYYDPTTYDPTTNPNPTLNNAMKACFSDFLKLRHGGSGYVFGYGTGAVGQNGAVVNGVTTALAAERPFRSLSYPDIDYTILRPATMPPSGATTPPTQNDATGNPLNYPDFLNGRFPAFPNTASPNYKAYLGLTPQDTTNPTPSWVYTQDPGVKSPYLYTPSNPVQPPPLPPRRLFQVPDYWGYQVNPPMSNTLPPSNAGSAPNANGFTGDPAVSNQVLSPALSTNKVELTAQPFAIGKVPPGAPQNVYLGGGNPGNSRPFDQRDNPYFRTEWLQKVANLTTVRTHQYAVWITVGFFEVTRQGDPSLLMLSNLSPAQASLAYDLLGLELGVLDGKNVRYRGFFILDRTRATGFNPALPGDFRDCIVYRQLIE